MNKKTLSIVISAFNEQDNIEKLYTELVGTLSTMTLELVEFIFVNDGSSDQTYEKCLSLQQKDPRVKIVNFKRNFGHEIAMTAGMDYASYDGVLFMDADLQHPPSYIPIMVKEWQNGHDLILTRRVDNKATSPIYKCMASIFYKILNTISDTKIPEKMPDFRLLDRKYIDFLKKFDEQDRLFRGLLNWMTDVNHVKMIDFIADKRFAGKTKYHFAKSLRLAIDALLQFSTKPLRLSIYLGIITAFISIGMMGYVVIEHFILHRPKTGYATTIVIMTMLGSIQLIVLGIIGEYIGKIHMEVKNRPLYFAEFIEAKK